MGKEKNIVVINKKTLIVIGLIFLAVVVFVIWDKKQKDDDSPRYINEWGYETDSVEVKDINPNSAKEKFDRDEAIEKLSEDAYYDCYDQIIKLNPTMTSSENLEYFREVCKIKQKDYALSLEEYDDGFLEYLLSPAGRKAMREIQEEPN